MDYSKTTRFTSIETQTWMIPLLQYDIDLLFAIVKSILIHPIDTKKYKIRYDRTKNGIEHVLNNTVNKILANKNLIPYFEKRELPLQKKPEDRCILSCDHHALLFTSLLRNQGIQVRARTGYAKYIVKGLLIPHWIVEVYDEKSKEWVLIDPERCIKNVDKKDFVFANEAWIIKKMNLIYIFPVIVTQKINKV